MDDGLAERALRLAEESFLAGSGPGGQNANKVATEVQLRVNVYALGLEPAVFERLRKVAGSKFTASGELLITPRRHRTQEANRAEARAKLAQLLEEAQRKPRKRARPRLNRGGQVQQPTTKKEIGTAAGRERM